MTNRCGVPANAIAISINVTVVNPTALGHLTVFPAGSPVPSASTLNYRAGQVRAGNAILPIGIAGGLSVACGQSSGTANVVIDVNGYFAAQP